MKHYLILALIIVGGLYVFHIYTQHGGVGGFKTGLGIH